MKKFLLAIASSLTLVLLPGFALAASDTVTLSTVVTFPVGPVNLDVHSASSTIASVVVTDSTLAFSLESGSTATVRDSAGHSMSHDGVAANVTQTCLSGVNTLELTATADVTVTITPGSTLCAGGGGSSSSSSGGGGGGGGSAAVTTTTTPPAATTVATTTTTTTPAPAAVTTPTPSTMTSAQRTALIAQLTAQVQTLLAQIQAMTGKAVGNFARDLQVGATGNDVKALQVYLNTHGYVIASSGPGSSGNETTKFGGLTRAALIKLQKAAGITPTVGYFGSKTRAYIVANP